MEAKNRQYSALQYLKVAIPETQLQLPNILFLTSDTPVFHINIEHHFIPLVRHFPAINIDYFQQIANNKFLLKNIVNLSMEHAQMIKYHVKFVQLLNN